MEDFWSKFVIISLANLSYNVGIQKSHHCVGECMLWVHKQSNVSKL